MAGKKEFTLSEGLNLNLTCRLKKGPQKPITWQKDGIDLNLLGSHSPKLVETNRLSMLMLTNLTHSDAGNYTCHSSGHSRLLTQWIYIHVKSYENDANGSRTVADEPHSKCQGQTCKVRCADLLNCKPQNAQSHGSTSDYQEERQLADAVGKGLPNVESTEPHVFNFDNKNGLQNPDNIIRHLELAETCDGSNKVCEDRIGGSTALIGIGIMCTLFFIAVIISGFFIRRKIIRRQRRLSRIQLQNRQSTALAPVECTTVDQTTSRSTDNTSTPALNIQLISGVAIGSETTKRLAALQYSSQQFVHIEGNSELCDVVYIPHSEVFGQPCGYDQNYSSLIVPLSQNSAWPELS
uniref:Ig-like domain-containing protein n=1 Tax=Mesocestoides corti TaxID=53468 RepID=A0A5K3FLK8_MESCO